MHMPLRSFAAVSLTLGLVEAASAQPWLEYADAPRYPDEGPAQVTLGEGPLAELRGFDFDSASEVDSYVIRVADPANFSATNAHFLFDAQGHGIAANPDGGTLSGQFVPAPGLYIVVHQFCNDYTPESAQGPIFAIGSGEVGPIDPSRVVESWYGTEIGCGGTLTSYTVALTGATHAELGPCPPAAVLQPQAVATDEGDRIVFRSFAVGRGVNVAWEKDGAALSDGGPISGASTPELVITEVRPEDTGTYRARFTSSCGDTFSSPVQATVAPVCSPIGTHALRTRGADGYAVVPHSPQLLSGPFTIEFWARAPRTTGALWVPILSNVGPNFDSGINIRYTLPFFGASGIDVCSGHYLCNTWHPMPASDMRQWNHIAVTVDSQHTSQLIVNGALIGPRSQGYPSSTADLTLGVEGAADQFYGHAADLDEVRIWNVARTPEQIAAAMDGPIDPATPGLVAYYGFEEESGPVLDLTGNGHHGTLTGSAVRISTTACCPADWNSNGTVNSADISSYLTSWLAGVQGGTLDADFNGDNVVNSTDISAFLAAWLQAVQGGC